MGFGEPSYRFDDICWVIDQMKAKGRRRSSPVWTPTAPALSSTAGTSPRTLPAGSTWSPCPSNTDTAEKYNALCHPQQENAYEAMKDFTKEVRSTSPLS